MASLIYIADPMCAWCYGFQPELSALLAGLPELSVDVVVGGLRTSGKQAMAAEAKAALQADWRKVEQASGKSFSYQALQRDGFIFDTEPACRAVAAARLLHRSAALPVLHAVQQAFFANGADIARGDVLSDIAATALTQAGAPIDAAAFYAQWNSEAAMAATASDFAQTRQWGVDGFPTLALECAGELHLVTSGFMKMPDVVERMQAIIDKQS